MSKEDAYAILEAIAEIHGYADRLTLWEMDEAQKRAEEEAQEIVTERRKRADNFTFSEFQIPIGAVLEYADDPNVKCTVVDDRRIMYRGEIMYITPLVKMISGKEYITKGPKYLVEHFTYKGALLWTIDGRTEDN